MGFLSCLGLLVAFTAPIAKQNGGIQYTPHTVKFEVAFKGYCRAFVVERAIAGAAKEEIKKGIFVQANGLTFQRISAVDGTLVQSNAQKAAYTGLYFFHIAYYCENGLICQSFAVRIVFLIVIGCPLNHRVLGGFLFFLH